MSETENLSLEEELTKLIERTAHALGSTAASEEIDAEQLDHYLKHFCETLMAEFGNEAILERLIEIASGVIVDEAFAEEEED